MGSRETVEDSAMASYLRGSMNSLPDKLANPQKIGELQSYLLKLKACFVKVAERGKTDDQAQEWMKQVRDLFFNIEDWMDEKLETPKQKKDQQLGTSMAGPTEIEEEKKNIEVDPVEIEENIKGFITLTVEACDRCTRYKLVDEPTTSGASFAPDEPTVITSDSRFPLEETSYLIGLDQQVKDLKNLLADDQRGLMVVSIVGTGGLGKTTLAKKIREELEGQFECGAFVHVGRWHPPIWTILVKILHQIASNAERERLFVDPLLLKQSLDEQQVIAEIWALLSKKRYFIILDCIWSIRTWRVISCALPDNNLGSRILVTTRMKDVAKSCSPCYTDVVYEMKALSNDDSKRLFDHEAKIQVDGDVSKRLFDQEEKTQVDDDLLKKCSGVPLAVTLASGLSIGKYTKLGEPMTLGQHMLSSLEHYCSLSPEMMKILHMSYAELSIPVRSCFLYLSVFPEHYTISKDHLIPMWVGEGFIPRIDDESFRLTGERYFNELISRRLIQPVFGYKDAQAVGCTVHPVILDFIRTLSREENFATTGGELSSGPFLCDTIRRFSLDCSNEREPEIFKSSTEHLSSIRSLALFGVAKVMPFSEIEYITGTYLDLSPFKLLRVLELEDDENNLPASHLKGIGGLIMLRYLGLGLNSNEDLTDEIGELKQLTTLNMRRGFVDFSGLAYKLKKLVHILFPVTFYRCPEIHHLFHMTELEEVSNITVRIKRTSVLYLEMLLSNSKRLRILGVTLVASSWLEREQSREETKDITWRFLAVLAEAKLDSLSLYCPAYEADSVAELLLSWKKATASTAAKFEPRRFELNIYSGWGNILVIFPPYMDSLGSVTHLHIPMRRLEQKGLGILGNMQRLVLLNLSSYKPSINGRYFVKEGEFLKLVVFSLTYLEGGMGLQFGQGAMPQLRRLALNFTVSKSRDSYGNFNFGMKYLTCLTRIQATINCRSATVREIEAAESQAREEVSKHINKPRLELFRDQEDK